MENSHNDNTTMHDSDNRIVVEVLDRFGKIKHREIVKQFPCRVGRAYDNDIILDDPYISPRHAEIRLSDAGYELHDLGSENGTFTLHPLVKHHSIDLKDSRRVRVGHTDIRFRLRSHPIEETMTDHGKPSQLVMLFTNGFMFPVVWACLFTLFVFDNYLSSAEQVSFNTHLKIVLPFLVFITLWSITWSVISKVVTHRFYFAWHAMWAGLLILVSYLAELSFAFIEFGFSLSGASGTLTLITDLVLMSVLFYGHLRYSTTVNRQNAKRLGIMASVVITVFLQLNDLADSVDFSNRPSYSNILKPPAFIFATPRTTDDYLKQTGSLKYEWDEDELKNYNNKRNTDSQANK